jgi:hypothetical protein
MLDGVVKSFYHTLNLIQERGNFFKVKFMENFTTVWALFLLL